MVRTEHCAFCIYAADEQFCFIQYFVRCQQFNFTSVILIVHFCTGFDHQCQEANILRFDGRNYSCTAQSVFSPVLFAAQTGNNCNGNSHTCCTNFLTSFDHFVGSYAFFHEFQNFIRTGFQTHVNHVQTGIFQLFQFFRCFVQDILGCAVNGNSFTFGEVFVAFFQDIQQIFCFYDQRIAVCQENSAHFDAAVIFSCHCQIFHNFFQRTDAEFFVFIHVAECACISCTADCQLNDQAACLTGGSVYCTFVSHRFISPFQNIFYIRFQSESIFSIIQVKTGFYQYLFLSN